jgi:rhodanese-related sulfurtransferase
MIGIVLRASILLAAGSAAGFVVNMVRSDGVDTNALPAAVCTAEPALSSIRTVSVKDAQALCQSGRVLVADARTVARFAEGHIAGAVHLPCAASGEVSNALPQLLDDVEHVLVYGDGTEDATEVAKGIVKKRTRGDLDVMVLRGGFSAWFEAGLACQSGPCPACLETPGEPGHDTHEETSSP